MDINYEININTYLAITLTKATVLGKCQSANDSQDVTIGMVAIGLSMDGPCNVDHARFGCTPNIILDSKFKSRAQPQYC